MTSSENLTLRKYSMGSGGPQCSNTAPSPLKVSADPRGTWVVNT